MSETIRIEDLFNAADHKLIIRDIFAMYHHQWDVIGECIQNAVDSVLKRGEDASEGYTPCIKITYDAQLKKIIVEDNGVGISAADIKRIAAPHVSLKNPLEANRGEFGVGLTLSAFSCNDFGLESVCLDTKSSLKIKSAYKWVMDNTENMEILFDSEAVSNMEPSAKVYMEPFQFPEYSLRQLEYILRRYTAIGDFWSCCKKEDGSIKVTLTYVSKDGQTKETRISNKLWHPADFLNQIGVESVDLSTVQKEVNRGKEYAIPNWIGFGLTDMGKVTVSEKDFTYYALFCRANYYKRLSEEVGLVTSLEEDEEGEESGAPEYKMEGLQPGIFACKKGMPLGAIVDHPRTAQAGYWRGLFIVMNCDTFRTEPGRKKLHVDDENIARNVARKIFYDLTKFSHYIIPRDPDEEMESLLRNVDKNLEFVRRHRIEHRLINPRGRISIYTEPVNEQTLIGLFHELIGAEVLIGYKALKLSAAETYDGIYEYDVSKDRVGNEHWQEWLRGYRAKERREIEDRCRYHLNEIIVEFKMNLQDIIKDFLQKTKYHSHIKLIVSWDANNETIKRKGWLLEELPKSKRKFCAAKWRLRPSAEGQTRGILATDVLLLKDFLSTQEDT